MPKRTSRQQRKRNKTAAAQSHFNDICRLIDHPTQVAYDPNGRNFDFKKRLKQRTLTNLTI